MPSRRALPLIPKRSKKTGCWREASGGDVAVQLPNWYVGVAAQLWCGCGVVAAQLPNWRTVARHKGLALLPLELPARTLFEHCSLLVAALILPTSSILVVPVLLGTTSATHYRTEDCLYKLPPHPTLNEQSCKPVTL